MPRLRTLRLNPWLGLALLAVLGMWAGAAFAAGGTLSGTTEAAASSGQFIRIGLSPLRDDGNLRDGAADLLEIWQAQLEKELPEVEFVLVDPSVLDLPAGPLLLDEAVKLGAHYEVEALLTGVFGGVEITGGTWPNHGSSYPAAKGAMSWRLVECRKGLLVADGVADFDKPKSYSARTRDTAQLARRVLQDLARMATEDLKDTGTLAGTMRPGEDARE